MFELGEPNSSSQQRKKEVSNPMPSNRTINIYRPYDAYIVSRGQPPRGILLPWFPQSRRGISSLIRSRARFHLSFLLIFAKLQARRQSDMVVWRKAVARNRTPCVSLRNLSARGTHTYRCLVSEGAETEQADIDPRHWARVYYAENCRRKKSGKDEDRDWGRVEIRIPK